MRSLFFFTSFFTLVTTSYTQSNWFSNLDIYAGIGFGIGVYDKSYELPPTLVKVNQRFYRTTIEYTPDKLPFSLDYEIGISNYYHQADDWFTSSSSITNKVGIGLEVTEQIFVKTKYIIKNHGQKFFKQDKQAFITSIGYQNQLAVALHHNKYSGIQFIFRVMLFYEHHFNKQKTTFNYNFLNQIIDSPTTDSIGLTFLVSPRIRRTQKPQGTSIFPPY